MSKFHKFYISVSDVDKFGSTILPYIKINDTPLTNLITYDGTFIHINKQSSLYKYFCEIAVDNEINYSNSLLFYFPQGTMFTIEISYDGFNNVEFKIGSTSIMQTAGPYNIQYKFPVMENIYIVDKTA